MSKIVEKFKVKYPKFPKKYVYLFERYARKWGGSTEERIDKAKVFRNNYELYMYAFFLGVRKKRREEIRKGELSKENVMQIKDWKPTQLSDYLIACVLAEEGTPLREYDLMNDETIDDKSKVLQRIVEEYTKGGLMIIDEKYTEDKDYFSEDFAFTNFVFE